jgi:hypothetical protein
MKEHRRKPSVRVHTITKLPAFFSLRSPPIAKRPPYASWIAKPGTAIVHVNHKAAIVPKNTSCMTKKIASIRSPLEHTNRTVHAQNGIRTAVLQKPYVRHIRSNRADSVLPRLVRFDAKRTQHLAAQVDPNDSPTLSC